MSHKTNQILIGGIPLKQPHAPVSGEYVTCLGEVYYKINNYDSMEPFFMSIVSSSNHWLFISSTGGMTAGRVSAEQALFPYYTVDKLTENNENTGVKAILLVSREEETNLWEPFSDRLRGCYTIERNLYKNIAGTAVIFEECNLDIGLTYRYAWRTSDQFGFIKTGWLRNTGDRSCRIELLDGIQNILPANVASQTQNTFGSLLDAYKRNELEAETGMGIFALNSTLTDLPEPSESLLATVVFQLGLEPVGTLLSSRQLDRFRAGEDIENEREVRGQRGAYFIHSTMELAGGTERSWHLAADVCLDSAAIIDLSRQLKTNQEELLEMLEKDIAENTRRLNNIVASSDGCQLSEDQLCSAHHFANVMFNVMRGGYFGNQYRLDTQEFKDFIQRRNPQVLTDHGDFFSALPEEIDMGELQELAEATGKSDLIRLSYAAMPLSFSRRHGDPSRPWNRFEIDLKKPDGTPKTGYEGNWRDIFQNWEALAYSYPEYIECMISTFLDATTVDGYNPYRITSTGIDWEKPEPGNPWANIGYWSDHQIIYLLKLMEISAEFHPQKLQSFLSRPVFSYANVPYRLKNYADLLKDPYNTIAFDWEKQREIENHLPDFGMEGKLVLTGSGKVLHVTLAEKLLTLTLAKMANFVPEGGIWMNTQRPEWNDANNALVGKGLSVVTLGYLRRFITFYQDLLQGNSPGIFKVSREVKDFFTEVFQALSKFQNYLLSTFTDASRREMMDELGRAGSDYRWNYYSNGLSGETNDLKTEELAKFLELALQYVEHSLRANKRSDDLYHAYNILHLEEKRASIGHLYEMLEGQAAILSAGMLSGEESLSLLRSLRQSQLYRPDQKSYILYPDRDIPGFLQKNRISPERISGSTLIPELVSAGDKSLILRDIEGCYHFSGQIRNGKDVKRSMEALKNQSRFRELVEVEAQKIEILFEEVFHHNEYTGRSGTFFAYEGLGSVYWHMVSKLLLAVQETIQRTRGEPSTTELIQIYYEIRSGLGFNKSAVDYGAFPTDPYSHTPKGKGAQQPGMTGAVKEEILTRLGELGLFIKEGRVIVDPFILNIHETLQESAAFTWPDVNGKIQSTEVPGGAVAFTFCQVPFIIKYGEEAWIEVFEADGGLKTIFGNCLDENTSQRIFRRDGSIHHLLIRSRLGRGLR
jgi:hypothetical protein